MTKEQSTTERKGKEGRTTRFGGWKKVSVKMVVLLLVASLGFALAAWQMHGHKRTNQASDLANAAALSSPDTIAQYIMYKNPAVFPELANIIVSGIFDAAKEYNVPVLHIVALMGAESTYKHDNVSPKKCVGLMQVNPKVWVQDKANPQSLTKLGIAKNVRDLYNPRTNIRAGTYILAYYIAEGVSKREENPTEYGVTRYLGGTSNSHYKKVCGQLGDYVMFASSLPKQVAAEPTKQQAAVKIKINQY